ncbi:MAG: biopolymer transporter ExbD [Pseudomonadota bacterium]
MRFRPSEDEEPEINLIPLIDVLVLTLIFLLVTTSFSKESQLRLRLPEASTQAKPLTAQLRIVIDSRGQYYINDQQLINATAETVRSAMSKAAAGRRDPVVVVQADGRTPHEAVVRVMDAARRLGFSHLTFATQQPAGSSP